MAFGHHLENLRQKPEHIRKRIAFWSSFGITAIIFVFWLGSFSSFGLTDTNGSGAIVAEKVQKAGNPGQSMVAAVGSLFTDIKEIIFGSKKVEYSSIEVFPK